MTDKEAIKRLKNIDIRDALQEDYDALHMAIKALEQTSWIPVSERLPEESGDYLVTIYSGGAYRCVDTSYFCFLDEGGTEWLESGVIAWQPLPEPYVESEDEE